MACKVYPFPTARLKQTFLSDMYINWVFRKGLSADNF